MTHSYKTFKVTSKPLSLRMIFCLLWGQSIYLYTNSLSRKLNFATFFPSGGSVFSTSANTSEVKPSLLIILHLTQKYKMLPPTVFSQLFTWLSQCQLVICKLEITYQDLTVRTHTLSYEKCLSYRQKTK